MKDGKIKIDVGRQTNFIIALLLLYFVFFGLICNTLGRDVGTDLIYVYKTFPAVYFGLPILVLFGICFFLAYSENLWIYGIKNALWLVPLTVVLSWTWYWVIGGFSFTVLGWYFGSIHGYLNILVLGAINFGGALAGGYVKQRVEARRERLMKGLEGEDVLDRDAGLTNENKSARKSKRAKSAKKKNGASNPAPVPAAPSEKPK